MINYHEWGVPVHNARCVQALRKEHGSFSNYLWSFVDGKPIVN